MNLIPLNEFIIAITTTTTSSYLELCISCIITEVICTYLCFILYLPSHLELCIGCIITEIALVYLMGVLGEDVLFQVVLKQEYSAHVAGHPGVLLLKGVLSNWRQIRGSLVRFHVLAETFQTEFLFLRKRSTYHLLQNRKNALKKNL